MPKEYEGRVMPGPVAMAACLIDTVETLYYRLIALHTMLGHEPEKEQMITELAEWRDEWKPQLERIIRRGR